MDEIHDCLIAPDPKARFTAAYREDRWDGNVKLYEGNTFPAGLAKRVAEHLHNEKGREAQIIYVNKPIIDVKGFPDHCAGLKLWKHQYDAAKALLANPRSAAKIPTAGGKTLLSYALAEYLFKKYKWKTLLITSRKGLARQTAIAFRNWSKGKISIGQCGDGYKTIGDITVATASTLMQFQPRWVGGGMREGNHRFFHLIRTTQVIIFDESHHSGSSDSWYNIGMHAEKAVCRWCMSGTPMVYRQLADLRMIGLSGPIAYSVSAKQLIGQGNAAKPKIVVVCADEASGPSLPQGTWKMRDPVSREIFFIKGDPPYADEILGKKVVRKGAYRLGVIENKFHNAAVIRCVQWCVDRDRQTLVLCRRTDHFKILDKLLQATGIPYRAIYGDTATTDRDQIKRAFQEHKIKVMLASDVMGEGEDLKAVKAIILAEGGRANTASVQRIGRGMRMVSGDHGDLWVVDFAPTCANVLIDQGRDRCLSYEREGYDVRVVDEWPDDADEDLLPFEKWDQKLEEVSA